MQTYPNPSNTAAFHGHGVARPLLQWFAKHRRALPWRARRTAYRVWVAEIMLQQTRVDQAQGYYRRFLRRLPSVRALAAAPEETVLKLWEGLGYYRRACNLQRAARSIVNERHGRLPATCEEWRRLPGVGPYTAAAIASIAGGEARGVLDGNVLRVISRLLACGDNPRSAATRRVFQARMDAWLPDGRPGDFNEAMMELGALVCLPRRPRCSACPLHRLCRAYHAGDPEAFPAKPPRRRIPHKVVGAGVILDRRGRVLIARRMEKAMLGGLWEFPGGSVEPGEDLPACIRRELREELAIETEIGARLCVVRHAYSHFTIELHAHFGRVVRGRPRALQCAAWAWADIPRLRERPFSRADLHVISALERWLAGLRGAPDCGM